MGKVLIMAYKITGSINSKEHIYPQVIIITVTKFRRIVFPSKTSAECCKRIGKNHLSLEKYGHR